MFRVAAAIVAASLTAGLAQGAVHYDVTDYGRPTIGTGMTPSGVDNAGHVVGSGGFAVQESYLFGGPAILPLRGPTGGAAYVHSINNTGHLAGMYYDSNFVPSHAAIWDLSGAVTPLEQPANTVAAEALDLNDANDVVGFAYPSFSSQIAVHWTADGSAHVLPGTGNVMPTVASVITGNGTIYGSGRSDEDGDGFRETVHLLRWISGVAEDLGAMECGPAAATDAGAVLCNGLGTPAYILDDTGTHELELMPGATINRAFDLSAGGVVTGGSIGPGPSVPTVWIDGQALALQDLVDPAWRVDAVGAINDKGQIAAWAKDLNSNLPPPLNRPHMVLLTPREQSVDVPGTLGLLAAWMGAAWVARSRSARPQRSNRVAAR